MEDAASNASALSEIASRFIATVPHVARLGIRVIRCGDDWVELRLPYSEELIAYPETGVIASGAIFSLMDSVGGLAVSVALGRRDAQATLDLRCDYLRPAEPRKDVIGRAVCYKITRRMAFIRGVAHDGDPERPIAHVAGAFMFTGGSW